MEDLASLLNNILLGVVIAVLYISARMSPSYFRGLWATLEDFPHIHWFRLKDWGRCILPPQDWTEKQCRCGKWKITLTEHDAPMFHERSVRTGYRDLEAEKARDRELWSSLLTPRSYQSEKEEEE